MPVYAGCSQFSYWKQKVSTDTNSLHRQVLLFRFRLSELPVGLSLGWFLPLPEKQGFVFCLQITCIYFHSFPGHFFFSLSL